MALVLIPTRNLRTEVKSKMSALKKRLQGEPTFPHGSPSRRAITTACQIAAEAGHFRPEGAKCHSDRRLTAALGQDRKHQRINDLRSRALWCFTSARTHLQQAHGKRGQQPQQTDQAINRLQLPLLNATPTFQALVIVLDQPPMSIPIDPLPGLFKRRGGNRGQQDPFQRLLGISRLLFPDAHDPHRHGVLARSRGISWWQERHLTKRQLELGRTPLATMPGWNWRLDGSLGSARTVRASANR